MLIEYVIFRTSWGYCGLAGSEKGLLRSVVPCQTKDQARSCLLTGLETGLNADIARENERFAHDLQNWIRSYLAGRFSSPPPRFDILAPGASDFYRKTWLAISRIPFGRTITYSQLAQRVGRPLACRAAARACGANPLPLLIPCHRVIRTDGSLGGYSAPGGIALKSRLLTLETT